MHECDIGIPQPSWPTAAELILDFRELADEFVRQTICRIKIEYLLWQIFAAATGPGKLTSYDRVTNKIVLAVVFIMIIIIFKI